MMGLARGAVHLPGLAVKDRGPVHLRRCGRGQQGQYGDQRCGGAPCSNAIGGGGGDVAWGIPPVV